MAARALLGILAVVLFGSVVPTTAPASPTGTGAVDADGMMTSNLEKVSSLSHPRPTGKPGPTTAAANESGMEAPEARVNPWGKQELTVAIDSRARNTTAAQRAAVAEAARYWNENHEAYSEYEVEFVVEPTAERADVRVSFVSYIDTCGDLDGGAVTLACAPMYEGGEPADVPTTVWVRNDRPREALASSVKHEFGHLLGIDHGEDPMPLMQERSRFEPRPVVRNASKRASPWHESVITVAIVQDGGYDRRVLRAHVREALSFYEQEPTDWDRPTPSFRIVEDPSRADIRLRVTHEDACEVGGGYCWSVTGEQLDRDAALEYYTRFEATFGDLDPTYLSWYAGRVIGYALGAEDESELPSTFAQPENADESWFDAETREPYRRGPVEKIRDDTEDEDE